MYKSRRRPWVKLYCREWLTSTVRFGLSESDRSRFIDLLALAGDSKVPGVVCAGYEHGRPSGYPIDWLASTMRCEVVELHKSLEKFVKSDSVSVTGPQEQPIIRITAWKKYQSEYLRQIEAVKARSSAKTSAQLNEQSSATCTQLPHTEVEGEVEGDGEEEVEVKPSVMKVWSEAFTGVNLEMEITKATAWLKANPTRKKKNLQRFYFNWLSRCHTELLKAEVQQQVKEAVRYEDIHRESRVGQGPR